MFRWRLSGSFLGTLDGMVGQRWIEFGGRVEGVCVGGRVDEGVCFVALGVKIRSVDGVVYVFLGGKIMIHILFGSII